MPPIPATCKPNQTQSTPGRHHGINPETIFAGKQNEQPRARDRSLTGAERLQLVEWLSLDFPAQQRCAHCKPGPHGGKQD